ncbi:MAG: LysE family transporter, partial [Chloroflexota bacterium]|nr:LysE family transporter [Chloroflexota bacterium]
MLAPFALGVAAGYAIAIPVGAIAVLILRIGMRQGLRQGALAGAGAATADLIYSASAVTVGGALSAVLAPVLVPLRLGAAAVLVAIGARLVVTRPSEAVARASATRTYAGMLGLTLLNPATIAYFVALAVALPEVSQSALARAAFVAGVALSSLSWQTILAAVGATLHARLSTRLERVASALGGVIVVALA